MKWIFMVERKKDKPEPPEFSPYLFPTILAVMGLWCSYDGWINTDPEMLEHLTFNRAGSVVLLSWAIINFIRTYRSEQTVRND